MSDERDDATTPDGTEPAASTPTSETPAAETPEQAPRRPSPTSRARRIGGAATPPRPTPAEPPPPVSTTKPARDEPVGPDSTAAPAAKQQAKQDARAANGGDATTPRRALPLRWIPAGVFAVAALVLLGFLVVSSHGVYWSSPDESPSARASRQQDVLSAASGCFAKINTYDYRKLDGLVQRDLACVTGKFTDDLRRSLQTQIIPLAPKVKATQTAQVNKAAISTVNDAGTQATVLIYGQLAQSNSTTAKQEPRIDVIGAFVTVDKVNGRWLISKVDTDVGSTLGS